MQFLSDLARRTLDRRAEKIPEMLKHKRNGKIAFMLMDKLIVYDKPPDTDRRGTENIANVPDHGNASDSHANGSSKMKQNKNLHELITLSKKKVLLHKKLLVRIHILTESICEQCQLISC